MSPTNFQNVLFPKSPNPWSTQSHDAGMTCPLSYGTLKNAKTFGLETSTILITDARDEIRCEAMRGEPLANPALSGLGEHRRASPTMIELFGPSV